MCDDVGIGPDAARRTVDEAAIAMPSLRRSGLALAGEPGGHSPRETFMAMNSLIVWWLIGAPVLLAIVDLMRMGGSSSAMTRRTAA